MLTFYSDGSIGRHNSGFHPEGIILGGGGGGKLQEMGVALYTFLYNCPKLGGGGGEASPPPWMKLCKYNSDDNG